MAKIFVWELLSINSYLIRHENFRPNFEQIMGFHGNMKYACDWKIVKQKSS